MVEQFFGRNWKLWKIARSQYRWDISKFDETIDIALLLTNEHIALCSANRIDRVMCHQIRKERKSGGERRVKRRASQARYVAREKVRMENPS